MDSDITWRPYDHTNKPYIQAPRPSLVFRAYCRADDHLTSNVSLKRTTLEMPTQEEVDRVRAIHEKMEKDKRRALEDQRRIEEMRMSQAKAAAAEAAVVAVEAIAVAVANVDVPPTPPPAVPTPVETKKEKKPVFGGLMLGLGDANVDSESSADLSGVESSDESDESD
eukprot:GHVO01022245.1.p2 GENE.GHVO01022245.1~~GHVO01022245.1.p2  ORF type:complete len:185 (-),score=55.01 GHVO01022245.1:205-708(-)